MDDSAPQPLAARADDYWERVLSDRRNIDAVVVLTKAQLRDIVRGFPELATHAIPHAATAIEPPSVERDPARVVFVGRLEAVKRIEHLILAFEKVHRAVPHATLDIYGEGSCRPALEALVKERGLATVVTFKGHTASASEAFASAQCATLTSHSEGFAMVLGESMAVGTPMVSYDIDYGPRDAITDGVNGRLVEPGDIDALAAALVDVVTHPEAARDMGHAATAIVETYSSERFARNWKTLIESLL